MVETTTFLLAQAMPPLFNLGPFEVSRSVDAGTLLMAAGMLAAFWRIFRSLDRWKDSVNGTLYGDRSPDGRTVVSIGLVERVRVIEQDCPVLHQHARKDDDDATLHRRSVDR
jgi:cytolysin (calcineurin-like family phosphatase)